MVAIIVFGVIIGVLIGAWAGIGWWARRKGKHLPDPTDAALQYRIDTEARLRELGARDMTTWDDNKK